MTCGTQARKSGCTLLERSRLPTYNVRMHRIPTFCALCVILVTAAVAPLSGQERRASVADTRADIASPSRVIAGADRLFDEYAHLIRGKRLALVSNHSGRLADGTHLAGALHRYPDATLRVLEHDRGSVPRLGLRSNRVHARLSRRRRIRGIHRSGDALRAG